MSVSHRGSDYPGKGSQRRCFNYYKLEFIAIVSTMSAKYKDNDWDLRTRRREAMFEGGWRRERRRRGCREARSCSVSPPEKNNAIVISYRATIDVAIIVFKTLSKSLIIWLQSAISSLSLWRRHHHKKWTVNGNKKVERWHCFFSLLDIIIITMSKHNSVHLNGVARHIDDTQTVKERTRA